MAPSIGDSGQIPLRTTTTTTAQSVPQGTPAAVSSAKARSLDAPTPDLPPVLARKKIDAPPSDGLPPPIADTVREEKSFYFEGQSLRRGDHMMWTPAPGGTPVDVEIVAVRGKQLTFRPAGAPPSMRYDADIPEKPEASPFKAIDRPPSVDAERGVLLIGGTTVGRGDAMRLGYWGGEDYYTDRWVQVRDIGVRDDGQPRVVVDEHMYPGRTRTRELDPRELEGASRTDDIRSYVRAYLKPIPEGVVVRKGQDGINTFRIGNDEMAKGDRVLLEGGATARILDVRAGDGGKPVVTLRYDDGRARTLSDAEVKDLQLDRVDLAARHPERSPWPAFEVVRPEGKPPSVVVDGKMFHAGDVIRFDRGTPGDFPVKIDRIDEHDRVWIEELVPLGSGETKQAEVEVGGKKFIASFAGPLEPLVRPIDRNDGYLFDPMPKGDDLKYKSFSFQDLGWAVNRASCGKSGSGFEVRHRDVAPGDAFRLVRGGQDLQVTLREVAGDALRVELPGGELRTLEKADLPFLLPAPKWDLTVAGQAVGLVPVKHFAERGEKIAASLAGGARFAAVELELSARAVKQMVASPDGLASLAGSAAARALGAADAGAVKVEPLDEDLIRRTVAAMIAPHLAPGAPDPSGTTNELGELVAWRMDRLVKVTGAGFEAIVGVDEQFGHLRALALATA